ncbi:TPA: amino acid permease [Streptococcus pyogenes]|uniref:amino acid permease n=1 Tax=Streptococcus pyogenes TaxID=1314 RepID=UPI0010A0E3E8|nr:amino acid permease [Streptococcus pyogenes]QCK34242.1 amino acid permease [Streptococcus pyogenes]VGR10509.1 amino acid permease [Streptococcus pyogenes]VGW41009.1 amino acid permease [Streptococcus pyogenes]VGW78006.1 amino acid permease [Streptococcus pyogenes]VGX04594.1 amino acid permease [Streptococcus pyogenes]
MSIKEQTDNNELENGMVRGLENRHVQLIAIAGTIGTGLFLGAGRSIALTGPSIIFVYMITGAFMFMMMRAIGEMLYYDPDQHTFINFISKYIGPGWGYFSGLSYWISLIFIGMAEITAVGAYVQFWFPSWPAWLIQLVFLVLLSSINLIAVRVFGETEFWFAMIKILAILALIATAIFMVLTGFETHTGHASLSNIFDHFSMFPNGKLKFFMAFQMVFFAYQAIEFVGITTSETANPRKVLPKAIQEIPTRIVIFYVGALVSIMAIVPWHQLPVDESPFVMVFKLIGIKWAAALINFVVLTSAASALNSTLYSTGRHLYQIANEAPNALTNRLKINTLSRQGVPSRAIIASAVVVGISALINILPGVADAFSLITASSSGVYIAIYALTMIAHWKYRQSKDFMADGYLMPKYKVTTPLTLAFFAFVFISLFLQESTYIGAIGATIWIIVFGIYSNVKFK